jgi:anthranilate phosphoribosyltransferase
VLTGLLSAVHGHCLDVDSSEPVVVMASAGGPRHLPVLTPLLALWLAREGVRVLLHGPESDPVAVTSAEVLRTLGLGPARQATDIHHAWSRREPAFIATQTLCPAIAPLLQRHHGTAWRSLARRLVRLLNPVAGANTLRVVHQGSHDSSQLLARWAERDGVTLMLLRGADGEPVVDLRRRPRIDTWLAGKRQPLHSCGPGLALAAPPLWPQQADAATTALYVQAVLSGERPAPAPLATQVSLILGLMPRLRMAPDPR